MQLSHLIVTVSLGLGVAGAAAADGMRFPVGDLDQRDAAIAFDHRLAEVAGQFCYARYRPLQLTPAQRDALAAALRPASLANR